MSDQISMHLRLDPFEHRALGLATIKAGSATRSEFLRALIRFAAATDNDVSVWLEAFPETASTSPEPREIVFG